MLFAADTLPPMHWLQRLGLIDSPADTVLRAAELRLRGLLPFWLAALLFVVGVFAAVWLYRRENPRPGPWARGTLIVLRSLLLLLVLALLLRPVLLADFAGDRPRGVVVLVDTSQSMALMDRRFSDADRLRLAIARGFVPPTTPITDGAALAKLTSEQLADAARIDLVKAVFASDKFDLQNRLKPLGPVQAFLFDRRLTPAESATWAGKLTATGTQTGLADAIVEVLTRLGPEPPAALVVVTDGHDNASKRTMEEAAKLCLDRGVPLHIWGVGSSEAGVLQVKDVRVPPTLFIDEKAENKDDPFDITVRYRSRGFTKGTIVLTAKLGDQTLTERFPVQEGENLTKQVRFEEPKKGMEGDRAVSVTLRYEPPVGEKPLERPILDEVNRIVQVKNSRVKVLVVENTPRREYHFINPTLNRDRRVLMRVYLAEGDPQLPELPPDAESGSRYLGSFPENFPEPDSADPDRRPYDLVILGDIPYARLGDEGGKKLARFVQEGGGLVVLAGKHHAPAEFVNTPLAEALPVEITKQQFTPDDLGKLTAFRPVLSYDGEQSTVLLLADKKEDSLKLWKEDLWKNTPGFEWYYPVADLRPGAVALLVHPDRKVGRKPNEKPMPLIATHYYGKGEVIFVGTDETWRWRDSTGDRLTARFWGQIVARFGLPHLLGNAKRTQISVGVGGSLLGRPGTFEVRLLDAKFEPVTRPEVPATLVNLDAKDPATRSREILLRRVPGQPGEYRGALPNDVPGRHELRVAGGAGLEQATLPFRVDLPPRHELEEVGLASEILRAAAATSGGRFYREEDLHGLPEAIAKKTQPFVQRQEVLLWNPLAMVAFLVLITAEWLVRKFSNLS